MSLNLHSIVRGAITAVNADETVTLYQAQGQVNEYGLVRALYSEPQSVQAQVQNATSADLAHLNNMSQSAEAMRFYLYADASFPPAGLIRPFVRTGDMIQRDDGTWWLVTSTPDDFARAGWVCVVGTLQEYPPQGIETGGRWR